MEEGAVTIELKPVVASYSGESYHAIQRYLNPDVLATLGEVARSPCGKVQIPAEMLAELIEMHVLREEDDRVLLATALFLEEDIQRLAETLLRLAQELAERILECGAPFWDASPEERIFLAGIVGLVQGLGRSLQQKQIGAAWKNYTGKYARSKVDFDEVCPAYEALGPDFLNKALSQGERYTAVFIGPGGDNFSSLLYGSHPSDLQRSYASHLSRYLVDAYADLVAGEVESQMLRAAAGVAGLYEGERLRTALITNETLQQYEEAIWTIADTAAAYYDGQLETLYALLESTTSGRQGVSPQNMLMHLWRYVRKMTARMLYTHGFFTDSVPEKGTLTVFYKNDVSLLRELLL